MYYIESANTSKHKMNRYKKEDLEKLLIEENKSYKEVGKIYGVSGNAIKKAALKFELPILPKRTINPKETFRKGKIQNEIGYCINCGKSFIKYSNRDNKYCSHRCQHEFKHRENYKKLVNGDPSIMRANYSPRGFKEDILKEQGNICAICGIKPEWNNKQLVFIIDHIDGKASNNKRDNLRCICPNCDSQLDTYKSKNKNGDRSYYRYHKYSTETEINK